MTPIIIDTDPGVDDAFAIIYAERHPNLHIVGLTTVFGNVSVTQSTDNAAYLREQLDASFDIARGAAMPWVKPHGGYPDFVHGEKGFGRFEATIPSYETHALSAANYIIEKSHEYAGELVLVPLGPLTNIANALRLDPSLPERIKRVVLMGGAARTPGNVSPVAEANIWGDPHAAHAVFAAPWQVVMIGLDVTHQVVMSDEMVDDICESLGPKAEFIKAMASYYGAFYKAERNVDGFCVHDPTTLVYLNHPEFFEVETGMVSVVAEGPCHGQTVFAQASNSYPDPYWSSRSNNHVCFEVNADNVNSELIQHLKNF
ncbi:MAG: nucleoside hydrolase [Gammaproteobacteria bacterium]|nr:nucleoside hydrolase [Gammaproteobacteria bacterium]